MDIGSGTGFPSAALSNGKTKQSKTVFTRNEFCSRLTKIRNKLQK